VRHFKARHQRGFLAFENLSLRMSLLQQHFLIILSVCLFACSESHNEKKIVKEQSKDSGIAHVSFDEFSPRTFDAGLSIGNEFRSIRFKQYSDDKTYHRYSAESYSIHGNFDSLAILSKEIKYIKLILDTARERYNINLQHMFFQDRYKDVLDKYVKLFENSLPLKTYKRKSKNEDYPYHSLVKSLLLKSDVYKPWDSLLNYYGYYVIKYETGEHSNDCYSKDFLKQMNYDTTLIVPWLEIYRRKIEKRETKK
jgi:hypothetical protein